MGKTLRSKMLMLYLITVIVPLVIILILLPYYYNGIFVRQTIQLSEGTLVSLTTNIEMYLDDLDRLTLTPYLNDDVMVALKQKASNEFDRSSEYSRYMAERAIRFNLSKQMRNTRKDILGTILLPVDGSVYQINAVDRSGPVPGFPYEEQTWYRKAVDQDGRVAFISSHPQNYIQLDSYKQVFSVARLLKDPDSGKPLAVIMTDAANVVLENIIHQAKFNVSTIVAILDENNRPLYSSRSLEDSLLGQLSANPGVVKGNHDSYRMISRTMPSSGWRIVV
ncbi:MAG: cache domain-containing protein, partial [Cohnella sp.]|nr:cache domain-containing protein [Cohnella sp.]